MNRNLAERERRSNMRSLFSRLFSLLPHQPTRMSIPEMLELARVYISELQRRIEEFRQRRIQLEEEANRRATTESILNITDLNSSMEVNLITGPNVRFTLSDTITVIEEEGGQVLSVAYKNEGELTILSIHCQAVYPRIGIESSRLLQRLRTMIEGQS